MNDRQIQYFLSVAGGSTFTATSKMFHISQPTISAQISALEDELNVKLFIRKSGGTELTEAGKMYQRFFLETEKKFKSLYDQVQKMKVNKENSMSLCVLSDLSSVVMPVLETFFSSNPNIDIQMNVTRGLEFSNAQLTEMFDIIIAFDYLASELDQHICKVLFESPQLLFYNKKFLPSLGTDPTIAAFKDAVFFMLDAKVSEFVIQQIKTTFLELNLAPPRFEMVKNVETMVLKVINAQGVAVLSETARPHFLPQCNCITLPFGFNVVCFEHNSEISKAAKLFRDALLKYYE